MDYYPDGWKFIKITKGDYVIVKLYAGFFGGYTYGDSWKLNSGCVKIEESEEGTFLVHGYSGSIYEILPEREGRFSPYLLMQLDSVLSAGDEMTKIEKISLDNAMEIVNNAK